MSDMPFDAEARQTSPFISIWWRPRQTIERIVAGRPDHLVLPLAAVGCRHATSGSGRWCNSVTPALSVLLNQNQMLQILDLTGFLHANRQPPPDQVRGHASLENAIVAALQRRRRNARHGSRRGALIVKQKPKRQSACRSPELEPHGPVSLRCYPCVFCGCVRRPVCI